MRGATVRPVTRSNAPTYACQACHARTGKWYGRCPKCGDPRSKPVTFTWWGGLIGPKLLSHVKCLTCGSAYNGKTGRYNTTGILIYTLAGLAIVVALMVAAALAGK